MRLVVGFLRALHVHLNDQVVLRPQEDEECVNMLDPDTVVDGLNSRLNNNVDLMWCTPNSQHVVVCTRNKAGDNSSMTTCHSVLVVR